MFVPDEAWPGVSRAETHPSKVQKVVHSLYPGSTNHKFGPCMLVSTLGNIPTKQSDLVISRGLGFRLYKYLRDCAHPYVYIYIYTAHRDIAFMKCPQVW